VTEGEPPFGIAWRADVGAAASGAGVPAATQAVEPAPPFAPSAATALAPDPARGSAIEHGAAAAPPALGAFQRPTPSTRPFGAPLARPEPEPEPPARDATRRRPSLSDLAFEIPDDLSERLVGLGALVIAIGFLLPWSRRNDYFLDWGFSTLGNVPPFLASLGVLAFAAVALDTPRWIRLGVPGVLLGGLIVGLLVGRGVLGLGLGTWLELGGSVAVIVGGILALRPERPAPG
jgi:hypothetical protein